VNLYSSVFIGSIRGGAFADSQAAKAVLTVSASPRVVIRSARPL
jgi:hypothetical protein